MSNILNTQHTIRRSLLQTVVLQRPGASAPPVMSAHTERESPVETTQADNRTVGDPDSLAGVCIGDFRLHSFLGVGAFAQVWKAHHVGTGVPVAIKLAMGQMDELTRVEFQTEVATLARLRHSNVVHVYDAGTTSEVVEKESRGQLLRDTPYVVMEYASRGTLENLRRPITWNDFVRIAVQVLNGLAHAHARGVLHRDIKPANVLLGSTSDLRSHIKLADFGIAFSLKSNAAVADPEGDVEAHILGTPLYMAPEQFFGAWRDYGPATDIYSFGVVAWELLTGKVPFEGHTVQELAMKHYSSPLPPFEPDMSVPDGTLAWLERLLTKDARDRIAFARHAAQQLLELGPAPATEPPTTPITLPTMTQIATSDYLRYEPMPPALAMSLLGVRVPPPMGRSAELARLCTVISNTIAGQGQALVTLRGATGVGVSHVGSCLVEALHEAGVSQTIAVFCDQHTRLNDAMRKALGSVLRIEGLALERVSQRLLELCGDVARDVEVMALAAWLDGAADPDGDIFCDWFLRLGRRQPLILWLDNSGEGVDLSDLLDELLLRARQNGDRCLVLHTDSSVRIIDPPVRQRWVTQSLHHTESIHPLDIATMTRVLDSTMPFSEELRTNLVEMSLGMPGRAMQAIRQWSNEQRLTVHDGRIDLVERRR